MKRNDATPKNSRIRGISLFLLLSLMVTGSLKAQSTTFPTELPIGDFLASQTTLLDRMEGLIQKTSTPTHQVHFRAARLAIQEAKNQFKDSLDVPLAEITTKSTMELQKIEARVREVWMSQNHYTPQRTAPEYEKFPAYEEKVSDTYQPNPDIPDLSYRQMRQLKAHTRTNFLVGVAFGSAIMTIATLLTGIMR